MKEVQALMAFVPDDCEAMPGADVSWPAHGRAERRLLVAMLCQAAVDANEPRLKISGSYADRAQRFVDMRRDARDWIRARSEELHGFDWVCQALGLDPDAVAAEILAQWTRAHTHRVLWMLRGGERGRRVVMRQREDAGAEAGW